MRARRERYYSRVTTKGQITLPIQLREKLDIQPKRLLEIETAEVEGETVIVVRRRQPDILTLRGVARPRQPGKPLEWKEIEQIAHEDAAEQALREDE